jgi:hypothetical protein
MYSVQVSVVEETFFVAAGREIETRQCIVPSSGVFEI